MPTYRDTPSNPSSGFTTDTVLLDFVDVVSNPSSGFTTDTVLLDFIKPPSNPSSGFTGDVVLIQFAPISDNPSNGWSAGPIIKQLSPTGGTTDGGTLVTITGKGFTGATKVRFDQTEVNPVSITDTTITAYSPAHITGKVDVRVVFTSDITPIAAYAKYIYASQTVVSSISPSTGPVGQSVVITGTGFTGATNVLFGGNSASYTVDSDTQITATAPSGTGQVNVQVVGLGGTSATNGNTLYTYVFRPSISSITPGTGPCVGGTSVTIVGTNFGDVDRVTFDGIQASSVTVVNSTTITCVSPRHDEVSTATVRAISSANVYSTVNGEFVYTNQAPVAVASASATSGRAPFTVTFSSAGSYDADGGVLDYYWNYGDNTSNYTTSTSISKIFTTAGTFNVKLVVRDQSDVASAETSQSQITITVLEGNPNVPPTAVATATPTIGIGPLNVSFNGSQSSDTDGNIVSYDWNFGDGDTSTLANPSHIYTSAGTFTATLTVTDNNGATNSDTVDVTVTSIPPPIIPTITNVSPNEGPVSGNTQVTLTGTGFANATSVKFGLVNGTIVQIVSNTEIIVRSPAGTGSVNITVSTSQGTSTSVATFNYRTLNTVTSISPSSGPTVGGTAVTIIGTNLSGVTKVFFGSKEASSVVVVDNQTVTAVSPRAVNPGQSLVTVYSVVRGTSVDQVFFTYTNQTPVAIASASETSGNILLTISFDGSSSYDPDGDYLTYLWDFGDGKTSKLPKPTHTFDAEGVYVVKLTVYDDTLTASSETEQSKVTITANANPSNTSPVAVAAAVSSDGAAATSVSGNVPLFVNFQGDLSYDPDGNISAYVWNFGDGSTSSAINPTHQYVTAGTFTATLKVYDNNGASNTDTVQVTVNGVAPENYAVPIVTKIEPVIGSSSGGDAVRIEGMNFGGVTKVLFSPTGVNNTGDPNIGGNAEIVRYVSDDRMTVISPQGVGLVDVIVFNPGGNSARSDKTKFQYLSPPSPKIATGPTNNRSYATSISGEAPLTVQFWSDESTSDFDIVERFWNFGDGSILDFSDNDTSSLANPSKTYLYPGIYTATLIIKDSSGITAKTSISVNVYKKSGIGFPGGGGGGGGPITGPGGSGGSGGGWTPPEIDPTVPPPPIYLNSSCTIFSTHVPGGWYYYGELSPDGYETTFSEQWTITRDISSITFNVIITTLKPIIADRFFIGAISITADGNFPSPPPTQTTAISGFGQGKTISVTGFSIEESYINGVYKPIIVGGVIPEGSVIVMEAKAPIALDIAYAQFGFLTKVLNNDDTSPTPILIGGSPIFEGNGDSTVAYADVDCVVEGLPVDEQGWSVGSIKV